ncbi:MAG: hypothetical protein HYR55_03200 [Acidobacteria bacterium]|nr:hypothetical protein [Acidobacteriota bacterium]MBI3657172.1 hypothetical protein [Acidobacteriota bacterium]
MEAGVYEEILQSLKNLPQEKVLEAKHFIDFLEQQTQRRNQGYVDRFSDLSDPPLMADETLSALLETVDEGYANTAARAARS